MKRLFNHLTRAGALFAALTATSQAAMPVIEWEDDQRERLGRDMIPLPACVDSRGIKVEYRALSTGELRQDSLGLAFAALDETTLRPYIGYDVALLSGTLPRFQEFVLAHECAHHQLAHTYDIRLHNFSESGKERLEHETDCHAFRTGGFRPEDIPVIADEIRRVYEVGNRDPERFEVTYRQAKLKLCR